MGVPGIILLWLVSPPPPTNPPTHPQGGRDLKPFETSARQVLCCWRHEKKHLANTRSIAEGWVSDGIRLLPIDASDGVGEGIRGSGRGLQRSTKGIHVPPTPSSTCKFKFKVVH